MADIDFDAQKEFVKPERLHKILTKLDDRYAKTRVAAAGGLGRILNPEAVPALAKALDDDVNEVRIAALHALAEIGSKSAVDALIGALDHPKAEVRSDAARHLGMVRAFRALDKLKRVAPIERDVHAKREMIEALGRLQDDSALTTLASFLTDKDSGVRFSATWAIAMIGRDTKSMKAVDMLKLLERHSDKKVKHEAATALRMINAKQV